MILKNALNISLVQKTGGLTLLLLGLSFFLFFKVTNAAPLLQEAPQLLQQPVLPLTLAMEAATAAVESCAAEGYQVAVTVVDPSGVQKVMLKGDGAGPHTIASSYGKAFTAASMRRATGDIAASIASNPELDELRAMDERILILAGGLPIEIDGEIVGGIGVGGAPGGQFDAACAQAGIDRIIGQ